MLKLTSRFVLEVLPYLLLALAAAVLLPGVTNSLMASALPKAASSPPQALETMIEPNRFDRDLAAPARIREDHAAFAPSRSLHELARAAEDDLVNR